MPAFHNIETTVTCDIDFEVFCAECGAGLCGVSDTRSSRNRGYAQVTVGNCSKCYDSATQPLLDEIAELKATVSDLEDELSTLKDTNQ